MYVTCQSVIILFTAYKKFFELTENEEKLLREEYFYEKIYCSKYLLN